MVNLDEFSTFLTRRYEAWRAERIRQGETSAESSQAAFTRELRMSLPSWSKLVAGNTNPSLPTLAKLAAHPAIGPDVYKVLGVSVPISDPDLAAIAEDWPYLNPETKRAIVEMARARVGSPNRQPERVTA
jgi:transcriptional regulator with XRE-family HTH domain